MPSSAWSLARQSSHQETCLPTGRRSGSIAITGKVIHGGTDGNKAFQKDPNGGDAGREGPLSNGKVAETIFCSAIVASSVDHEQQAPVRSPGKAGCSAVAPR